MSITPVGGWNRPDEGEVQKPVRNYTRTSPTDHVVVYEKRSSSSSAFGRAFFGCLGVLFALWCVFFGATFIDSFVKSFSTSYQETRAQQESAPTTETLRVSAPALNAAYQANEVSADEKYANKTLHVYGFVKSVDKDAFNAIHIRIFDDTYFSGSLLGVDAKLYEGNENIAAGLYKGQSITVRCAKVHYIVGTVMLDDCAIESVAQPQVPPSASAESDQPYNY